MITKHDILQKLGSLGSVLVKNLNDDIEFNVEFASVEEIERQKKANESSTWGELPTAQVKKIKYSFRQHKQLKRGVLKWLTNWVLMNHEFYHLLLSCVCELELIKNRLDNYDKLKEENSSLRKENLRLFKETTRCKQEKDDLLEKGNDFESKKEQFFEELSKIPILEKELSVIVDREKNLKEELEKEKAYIQLKIEEVKKEMEIDFQVKIEVIKQQVKENTINQMIADSLFQNEHETDNSYYDRKFYDELASRLQSVERERDEAQKQAHLLKMQQIANETRESAQQAKIEREWQKAEQSQSNAEMLKMKLEMEAKLKEEDLQRERQNLKIENTATQFDLQRQQLQVNFATMKNELTEMGLSFKDFVLHKTYEFKTYELGIKEHLLKMGEMINYVNARNLESEKIKMEVMERISQMGLELKQHETFLEGNLLSADRLKLETDRQNMVNEKQANEIALEMQRFNVDYGSKRNQLEQLMLKVSEAQFNNHAKASMLEMDNKVFEIQTELKGMAFERIGMDMMFKEGSMKLSEQENKIAMIKVQIEQKAKELQSLQKIGMLTNHIESERLKSMQRELALKGQITHMQNQLDREYMRADYMRQTISFLNG